MAKKEVKIKRQPIKSSTIAEAGYDKDNRILEIAFKTSKGVINAIWRYSPVSEQAWLDFQAAESAGKYFHANIKGNNSIDTKRMQ